MNQLKNMAGAKTLINQTLKWAADRVVFPPVLAMSSSYKLWKDYEPGDLGFDQCFVFEFRSVEDMQEVLKHYEIFCCCNVTDRFSEREHKARALAYYGRRKVTIEIN